MTLVCDDGQLEAHKVVIAACSPFFRNVLKRNPHPHPLLYLKNLRYADLKAILNFMYHGEANVSQAELNTFLESAEDLRVKGLTQGVRPSDGEAKSKPSSNSQAPSTSSTAAPSAKSRASADGPPAAKRPRSSAPPTTKKEEAPPADDDDIQEVVPVKSEPRDNSSSVIAAPEDVFTGDDPRSSGGGGGGGGIVGNAADDEASYDDGYDEYGQFGDQSGFEGGLVDPGISASGGPDGSKGRHHAAFFSRDDITLVRFEKNSLLLRNKTSVFKS